MGTLLHGVNHVAILTADMDRFLRFYQEGCAATVVHDDPNLPPSSFATSGECCNSRQQRGDV